MFLISLICIIMAIAAFWNFGFLAGIISSIILIFLNGYLTKFIEPELYQQAMGYNYSSASNPHNWHNLGNSYFDKHEYDKAISAYTKAIDIDPAMYISYCNRGEAYEINGLFEKALSDFAKAIEINPKFTVTYNKRAEAYKNKKLYEQAITDYYKIISIDPEDAEKVYVYFEIAQCLESLGQKAEAIRAYREYLQYASDDDGDVYEAKERLAALDNM